jgi:hypothetical protein
MVVLSVLIAIAAAYGGLRAFLARQGGVQLALSAVALRLRGIGHALHGDGGMHLVRRRKDRITTSRAGASPQMLSLVVALLCFVIARGFLLSLVPDRAGRPRGADAIGRQSRGQRRSVAEISRASSSPAATSPRLRPTPLGGIGQPPRAAPAPRLPVEGADGTHFIDSADVRSVRADAHYTKVHDGTRERMCPWSISEAEAQLDPDCSSGCTAATSWRSRTSRWFARRATARSSNSTARRRTACRSAAPRSPRSKPGSASPGATPIPLLAR